MLVYADREWIMLFEVKLFKLMLSGDPTVIVGGCVVASWSVWREGDAVQLIVILHIDICRADCVEICVEAERMACFYESDVRSFVVIGV